MNLSNKRKGLTLVLLTCLVMNISLHAQVTIGSANNPVAGAILDLNSGVAGGLVLSNVNITNPKDIPDGFPGITPANETAAKAGLKGAMVYNTNTSATCPGVHVWNGDYWERLTSMPVKAPGTILTSSNAENVFGNGVVDFTASFPGAKTYLWYVSESNDDYGYPDDITTIPTYSKAVLAGRSYKVKVIMDDCRSPVESNEVSFAPATVSPSFGSVAGGNYVYIYGNFDYASSNYYEQSGLVAHYDGIDNTGQGDKYHSNGLLYWKDRKANTQIPLIGDNTGSGWQGNGYKFATDKDTYFYLNSIPPNFPTGNHDRTIEVTFITPSTYPTTKPTSIPYLIDYGTTDGTSGTHSGVAYNFPMNSFFSLVGRGTKYDYRNLLDILPASLTQPNKINTSTVVYTNKVNDPNTKGYVNGEYYKNHPDEVNSLSTSSLGVVVLGRSSALTVGQEAAKGFTLVSYRLYDRTLTEAEVDSNAALDQIRFLTPPSVMFGTVPSPEVIVLSNNFLMCKVPPGVEGNTNVTVGGEVYTNAYKYVAANAFHISGISPIIGSTAGETLTLTGKKLNEIIGIKIDNADCPFSLTDNNTKCTVTLPAHEAGEVDILIITASQTYRLAKVFEYN